MSAEPASGNVATDPAVQTAVDTIARIAAVPSILQVCCRITGMGFAAVARVTEDRWTACAVRDEIDFGLGVGGELPVRTTLCDEVRDTREVIVFDHADADPRFATHHTPLTYGLQSYISMPILRSDGSFFGTLCAIDPNPHVVSKPETVETFRLFAHLIAVQMDAEDRLAKSEAALLDATETAELRDQFIAVLGHDLRNPLASIQAGATMLSKTELSDRARTVVAQMQVSGDRMSRLINDVLDFARGRLGGGLPLARQPAVELHAVLTQVIDELKAAHGARRIDVEATLTRAVACDPDRIAQLLSNLLANALAHGDPTGPVTVRARTDDLAFELSVANTGAPIPEAARAQLFMPFNRPRAGVPREGLGLGLYIAGRIAAAHDGSLTVSSDETETRFTFRMRAT